MKQISPNFFVLLTIIGFLFFSSFAHAATYDLNYSNVNLGVSGPYATVDIAIAADGDSALFTVDPDLGVFTFPEDGNFGIQKFGFNTNLALVASDFDLPDGWLVTFGDNLSSFGLFDANPTGTGSSRRDPLVFTVFYDDVLESNFLVPNAEGANFAAHIAGFDALNGQTSVWVSDVPIPSTISLLGLGLFGLIGINRRKK